MNNACDFATPSARSNLAQPFAVARAEAAAAVFILEHFNMIDPAHDKQSPAAAQAHAALIARLAQLDRKAIPVRPPKSLQPTPEAAKSRVRRLRKKRLLIQKSQRALRSEQPSSPPASDR
jgi:hypothetical protein